MTSYAFDRDGNFTIENYRKAFPFASFLPGIAGEHGIPMWAYYVNRGQGICGFGVEDKDHSIMEFFPACQAYQEVGFKGFRTFIKSEGHIAEPFAGCTNHKESETMTISPDRLSIQSIDAASGFKTKADYFTLPGENFAALCRKVTITKISEGSAELEVLDGLAELIPYGIGCTEYKMIGNTLKAWMDVFNLKQQAPLFRVRASTADTETASSVTGGFFCLTTVNGKPVCPIVDAMLIFGQNTSLAFPDAFAEVNLKLIEKAAQITSNKVPCAFTPAQAVLCKGETLEIRTMIGYVHTEEQLNAQKDQLQNSQFFDNKMQESRKLIAELCEPVSCKTGNPVFDAYMRQCLLDNMVRGGKPITFDGKNGKNIYYIYSRKHGDLERDYNDFHLEPAPYSQGNGNFRDICQNRRCDCFLFPETKDYNIRLFAELIQADGYNPLVINGSAFKITSQKLGAVLREHQVEGVNHERLSILLKDDFTPSSLIKYLVNPDEPLPVAADDLFQSILNESSQDTRADYSEGFWIDHWTYIMDLVETYLSIYPDGVQNLLFGRSDYKFYQSPAHVVPRSEKYTLVNGRFRQLGAVKTDESAKGGWMKTAGGKVFSTTLFVKLFILALVKFATTDPAGMGIEMEAGKPGWNDSLNGLTSLNGSSIPETAELKRLAIFLLENLSQHSLKLPVEVHTLLVKVCEAMNEYAAQKDKSIPADFHFWELTSTAREKYRAEILNGFCGSMETVSVKIIRNFLIKACQKLDAGLKKAVKQGNGFCPTYFYFEPYGYEPVKNKEIRPLGFKTIMLPHFLEGPTRLMKIADEKAAESIAAAVKQSDLYDKKLKMFKLSGSLCNLPPEVGRASAFTPGFLENESVFLHMEYKYLLSLLKAGLYSEFFDDLRNTLVPFMDPSAYGRSTIENSSFIASSANPDETLHGRGFVSRLSGATVEMLNIWSVMTVGQNPFTFHNGMLTLRFTPALPDWIFDKNGVLIFTFLGHIKVIYHNRRKISLCDDRTKAAKISVLMNCGDVFNKDSDRLSGDLAFAVREGTVKEIDVDFA